MTNKLLPTFIIVFLFFLGFGARLVHADSVPQQMLTLGESLQRAGRSNARLLEAQKELDIARVNSQEARSLFFPKINLNLNYVRYRNETLGLTAPELGSTVLEAPLSANSNQRPTPFDENLYLGRVGFTQTLYAGGRNHATYKLSKANLKKAEAHASQFKRIVEFQTTQAFYQLVATRDKIQAASEILEQLKKLEKKQSGQNKILVNQQQSFVRRKMSDVIQDRRGIKLRYLDTMGMEMFSNVDVDGNLPSFTVPIDLDTAMIWAKQNRSELRQTELQVEVDQLGVNLSMAERYPVFTLGGGVEVRDSSFPLEETNWNTALIMNIPIFDGFSSLSRIRESRYKAELGHLNLIQLEDRIEQEVRGAFDAAKHWQEEVLIREQELIALKKSANPTAMTLQNRILFINWLLDAELNLIDAKLELGLAKASLEEAVGRRFDN